MLHLPLVITRGEALKVPAPLGYESFRWHNRDQPEGTQLPQRQLHHFARDLVDARFSREPSNDFSTANDIVLRLAFHAVPVDQRETNTGVICRNPRAACWLAWENSPTIGEIDNLRRQSRKAVQFFVAIHREIKTLRFWEKRNGAH